MISHRFLFRTVTNIQKNTNVTKRVSFGIGDDKRPEGHTSQLSPGWWAYVADLVLSHGETYGGDRVAFGAAKIRAGGWLTSPSALVHRVNPVAGEELVFVIDWRVVQKS